jgi:tetratricopeptide (TPR) repeat protein
MKKYKTILASLFFLISSAKSIKGQSASEILNLAQYEIDNKNYQTASDYFERISFFESETLTYKHYTTWALAALQTNNLERSQQLLQRAIDACTVTDEKNLLTMQLAVIQLSNSNFNEAIVTLLSTDDTPINLPKKHSLLGICYFGLADFKNSEANFKLANPLKTNEISSRFEKIKQLDKRYKPKKAKVLNIILPGLGYMYLGKPWLGLNSFLLNVSLVTLGIAYASKVAILDALATMYSPIQRYYKGGYVGAEKMATTIKTYKQNEIIQELVGMMEIVQ